MKIKNIILTMALMGCSTLAFGQTVEQRMDSLQLLIGQQTILHLKATARKGARIVLPSFKPQDQIVPGVEVVEQSKGDTMQMGDDRIQVSRDYTLTSFDEKVYVVPALDVKIDGKSYHGNPLALKVLTVPVDTVHPNQFYPAKGVQDNPFEWSEWSFAFWLSLLMIIICCAMIYLRNRLKKNKPIIARIRIVKRVPAHEKALREINDIKHHHTSASQETQKEYYTQSRVLMSRRCCCDFWSSVLSVGTIFSSLGCSSVFVWSMKLMAFTRLASFSFIGISYLANFTRSAVEKSILSSSIIFWSPEARRCSMISPLVISIALNPKRLTI
jgi:hypothetical protein